MKNPLYGFLFLLLLGCNSHPNENNEERALEKTTQDPQRNLDAHNLQQNFALYKESKIETDTSVAIARLYREENKNLYPHHGLLVVTNKNEDTILTYFGNVKTIRNTYTFKKGDTYFIQFGKGSRNIQNALKYTRFYAVDTSKQSFYGTQVLEFDAVETLFYEKFKDSVSPQLFEYQKTGPGEFMLTATYFKDSLDFKIKYQASAPLEIKENDKGEIVLSAHPTEIVTSLANDTYSSSTYELDKPIGKINGYELLYNCRNCINTQTDGISIFAKKDSVKTKLFDYNKFGGNYLDDISLRYFDGHPFIYIHSTHTYGHSLGDLYALDVDNLKVNYVNKIEHNFRIPDSLYIRNSAGVDINKSGNFTFWASYRSHTGVGPERYLTGNYHLIHVKGNIYILEPINVVLE